MLLMVTSRVVRRAVIQCVADLGLIPVLVTGKRSIIVQYQQPSKMKNARPVYVTVAKVKISAIEDGVCQILVWPRLYGHDRPKVEELVDYLKAKEKVEGVSLKVVVES